jgi:outer membrane protein assembly factor BamE
MKRLALPTIFLLAVATFSATGCVYRMNIQQGNYLVPDSVSQLKEGMTRSQVRFLLGTPMVPDAFDEDRWDYYYYFDSPRLDAPLKRRLTIFFADEKVQRYENQGVPTQADLDQIERDLKRALAENQGQPKPSLWRRMTGRGASKTEPVAEPATASDAKTEAEQPPDPVPPAEPLPAPAGTPSGPT